ncbi:MAG: hypothetical protein Q4B43_02025 [Bacteroidota bacterium]|nr:hypothetical protein [Bacteroidota bacterium]
MENNETNIRSLGIICYILIIGSVAVFIKNRKFKNPYLSFHIRQSVGLSVLFILLGFIILLFNNISVTFSMWIFITLLWAYGLISAIRGECIPTPIVGGIFQKILKGMK